MKLSWSCEIPKNFWTVPSFCVFRLFLLYLWTNPTRLQLENGRKEEIEIKKREREVDGVLRGQGEKKSSDTRRK
jgi:hypothetical protein